MKDVADKYVLIDKLGEGNFGTVFQVKNTVVNRTEAIKIVPIKPELGERNSLEAKVLHKLEHSNIIQIYDAFIKNDKLYIAMEYVDGKSLQSRIDNESKISVKKSIIYAIDALYGLQHIHNKCHLHRDIKPSNILLTSKGRTKISDFGLIAETDNQGKYQSYFGYGFHKAPEVWTKGEWSKQADIYSLGLTLYRMVNGDSFLSALNMRDVPRLALLGQFPDRNEYMPDVPDKLRKIINQAMEVNPQDRYNNAHSMQTALKKLKSPIDWKCEVYSSRRQIWVGVEDKRQYRIEVAKNIFSKYQISYKKGISRLQECKADCYDDLVDKDMKKIIHRLLTRIK